MADASLTRLQLRNQVRSKLFAWPDAVTTLNGAVSSATAITITLTSVTGLAERMLLQIDSEVLRIVSISGFVVTAIRGDRGTTAATHSNGATVSAYPYWGWTDAELNSELDAACRWLFPDVWVPVFHENTVNADAKEFGVPAGWSFPDQIPILQVELENDSGLTDESRYQPFNMWRQVGDRLIFDRVMDVARDIRLTGKGKQLPLTSDSETLEHNDYAEALVLRSTGQAMLCLLANRVRYVEYSAALNDRASTPDEIQRDYIVFNNGADKEKDRCARVSLPGRISARRAG